MSGSSLVAYLSSRGWHRGWVNGAAVLLVLVLSVPSLLWFSQNWRVAIDSAWYLLQALNLSTGRGYTVLGEPQTVRGPVLPGLLALLMEVFGRDLDALAWALRLFAVVNPFLVYLFARRLFGVAAGLLAAGLVSVFGYTAFLHVAYNIDALMLTFFLAYLLVLLVAVGKGSGGLFLLSGALLGVAILTKETAFASLPLALVASLLHGRGAGKALWHYAGAALVCLPWWAWVWAASGEVYLAGRLPPYVVYAAAAAGLLVLGLAALLYRSGKLERIPESAPVRRAFAWTLALGWAVALSVVLIGASVVGPGALVNQATLVYLTERLAPGTPLWPLLILAGGYLLFRAVRRGGAPHRFLVAALVLQVPVSLVAIAEGFHARQYMVPQTLLLTALAALAVDAWKARPALVGARRWVALSAALVLAAFLATSSIWQVSALAAGQNLWKSSGGAMDDGGGGGAGTEAASKGQASVAGPGMGRQITRVSGWIGETVPEDENVLTTWFYAYKLAFLDGGEHDFELLEISCEPAPRALSVSGCAPSEGVAETPPQPSVWFRMEPPQGQGDGCAAVALSLPDLMRRMEEADARYLLLTPDRAQPGILSWAPYLVQSGAFEIAHEEVLKPDKRTGEPRGFALLRQTGEPAKPTPTRMDADTLLRLVGCEEKAHGPHYAEVVRAKFPHGVELGPQPGEGGKTSTNPAGNDRARTELQRIYGGDPVDIVEGQ